MRSEDWGLIDYESSVLLQQETLEKVSQGEEERVILCTHPPVVTLGRATVIAEDVQGWTGPTVVSSRGGRATYHGPNQLIVYPVVDLRRERQRLPPRDIHAYLRALERVTVACLRELGLAQAEARTTQIGEVSLTGVWVGERKIASIGIAIRKWITYHGVAINVREDRAAFQGIRPCGFAPDVMTSVERELGHGVDGERIKALFAENLVSILAEPGSRPLSQTI